MPVEQTFSLFWVCVEKKRFWIYYFLHSSLQNALIIKKHYRRNIDSVF